MGPDFGEIKRIETIPFRILERHHLHLQGPAGMIAIFDGIENIPHMIVGIFAGEFVRFLLRKNSMP